MITDLAPYPAMKDSGVEWLGQVPEHWEVERGKKVFSCIYVRSETGEEELLPDEDAEIGPVPTAAGGFKPEPELDRLSNIIKNFNDQFGNIPWIDSDRVRELITEHIPAKVAADSAYRNAQKNSDEQNARIEHDKALVRVMTAVMNDDSELFKQFVDNEGFKRWMTDTVFRLTYKKEAA